MSNLREIEARKAEESFAAVLELVERGTEVSITRDGREIARLVPSGFAHEHADREKARAAMERIRARAKEAKRGAFDWAEWKTYVNEGRR